MITVGGKGGWYNDPCAWLTKLRMQYAHAVVGGTSEKVRLRYNQADPTSPNELKAPNQEVSKALTPHSPHMSADHRPCHTGADPRALPTAAFIGVVKRGRLWV